MAVRSWRFAKDGTTERIERIETRGEVPPEVMELLKLLSDQIEQLRAAHAAMAKRVDAVAPVAEAIVDYAQETRGAA